MWIVLAGLVGFVMATAAVWAVLDLAGELNNLERAYDSES